MGLLRRRATDGDRAYGGPRVGEERMERAGTSPGVVRALFTLAGVAGAGFLIWLAQLFDLNATDEFWWAMLVLAAAGLALGLSQLFGGWTKWGWPTLSPSVFLLAFLPTLVIGGWILLANQPRGGWQQGRTEGWAEDVGVAGLFEDLATFLPAIPLIVGLVLAFSFDTTGPRTRVVTGEPASRDADVPDYGPRETRTGERTTTTASTTSPDTPAGTGSTVAEELRHRHDRQGAVAAGTREDRVDVRDPDRRDTV